MSYAPLVHGPIPTCLTPELALTFITGAVTQNAVYVADRLEIFRSLMAESLSRPYKHIRQYGQADAAARILLVDLHVDGEVRDAMTKSLDDAKSAYERRNRQAHDVWMSSGGDVLRRLDPLGRPPAPGPSAVMSADLIQLASDLVRTSRQLVACAFLTPLAGHPADTGQRRSELIEAAKGGFGEDEIPEVGRWYSPWRN